MPINPSFNGFNKLCKYNSDTYGFVSNDDIVVGSFVPVDVNDKGQPIYKTVIEILEERPSKGKFIEGTVIPTWYMLKVA